MGHVYIERLQLTDFRNWSSVNLACSPRHVVLTGENGAGKTNMLEALSFLSPGRGFRRASYESIARRGGPGTWSVFAHLHTYGATVNIGTGTRNESGGNEALRRIRINGATARTAEALLEFVRVVWVVPSMDTLFTGSASDRRRFLDRLVLAIDPTHARRVAAYEQSMRERNRLLMAAAPDQDWLTAIEAQMAETGVAITLARLELVSLLRRAIERSSEEEGPFPVADFDLPGYAGDPHRQAAADMEEDLASVLRQKRPIDAAAGRTLVGPHRSDLIVSHRRKAMEASRCSTGEQKALLVGIVLAHAQLIADITGSSPILLLDEIAAHLDNRRRAALFDRIDALGCQAWMTGTDEVLFADLGNRADYWRAANNKIVRDDG